MRTFSEFLLEASAKSAPKIVPGTPRTRMSRMGRAYQSGAGIYDLPQADAEEEKAPEHYSWEGHGVSDNKKFNITYPQMQETLSEIINVVENIGLKIKNRNVYIRQDSEHFNQRYRYACFMPKGNSQVDQMKILGVHRKALTNSYRSYNLSSNNIILVLEAFGVIKPTTLKPISTEMAQYLRSCVDIDVDILRRQIRQFKENLRKHQEGMQARADVWNTFTNIKDRLIAGGQPTATIKTSSQTNS